MIRACFLACLVLSGCQAVPVEPRPVAGSFVEALNAKNVEAMSRLAGIPFRYRNQQWESASDGSGYVLGAAQDRVAGSADELLTLLRDMTSSVRVEDPAPVATPPSKDVLLKETLKGAPSQWSDMNLVLFRRGEGDVEHVAIVGIDARGKVVGLYIN